MQETLAFLLRRAAGLHARKCTRRSPSPAPPPPLTPTIFWPLWMFTEKAGREPKHALCPCIHTAIPTAIAYWLQKLHQSPPHKFQTVYETLSEVSLWTATEMFRRSYSKDLCALRNVVHSSGFMRKPLFYSFWMRSKFPSTLPMRGLVESGGLSSIWRWFGARRDESQVQLLVFRTCHTMASLYVVEFGGCRGAGAWRYTRKCNPKPRLKRAYRHVGTGGGAIKQT